MAGERKPRKSGINIPESQRHTVQLKLRVLPEVLEMLDALRGTDTRSEYIAELIARRHKR